MPAPVSVTPVSDAADLAAFIRLPWAVYRGKGGVADPNWVPPLLLDLKKTLRPTYPFFRHGKGRLFLARRGGEVVGRVSAHVNEAHLTKYAADAAHAGRGFFGWFECMEDREAAAALLDAARAWLRESGAGLTHVRGPLNWDINGECPGVLVESTEPGRPQILMAHNPPCYGGLIEAAGFAKTMDLLAYIARRDTQLGAKMSWLDRMAGAARKRIESPRGAGGTEGVLGAGEAGAGGATAAPLAAPRIEIRELDKGKGYRRDMALVRELFNTAWRDNWGSVDISPEEMEVIADGLKPILKTALTRMAFIGGKPAGFIVCIPDVNQVLARMNGTLLPFGWVTMLAGLPKIDAFRTILMGVADDYRGRGVDAILINEVLKSGYALGYQSAELSWVLETNHAMNSIASKMGSPYRRYRLYEAAL